MALQHPSVALTCLSSFSKIKMLAGGSGKYAGREIVVQLARFVVAAVKWWL